MDINTSPTFDPIFYSNNIRNFIFNPYILITILIIIFFYVCLFSSLGMNKDTSQTESSNNTDLIRILSIIIILILFFLIFIYVFQYTYNINIYTYIYDLFTNNPKIDIVVDKDPIDPINLINSPSSNNKLSLKKKQVYNIPGNYYDYENAKAICSAYDSDLATYEQIEKAYEEGGEWCNYGWSDGQMALFPTQQQTFNNLQKIPKHEHDCGRPGINGGYIANPNVKFGVNCYGYKPKITDQEEQIMNVSTPYPLTKEDLDFQNRVDYWKNQINTVLISPFNYKSWNSW
jgi:hypothetical protein